MRKRVLKYCKCCGRQLSSEKRHNIFCSTNCMTEWQYYQNVFLWKHGLNRGMKNISSVSNYVRKYLIFINGRVCSVCKNYEWNNLLIPLEIDHIDGNAENNTEKNLRLICPNCHAQTDTYKGANKGNGRQKRT